MDQFFIFSRWTFPLQKMDKNRDGVVTIEEFIETCQKVSFDLMLALMY